MLFKTADVKKVGVYGGAFDPPHLAHSALIRQTIEQLGLDQLHVIPTGQAWHKPRSLSAPEDRLNMCRLAFSGIDKVLIDERELKRSGASYTVDSLRELRLENPNCLWYLIVGQDQFDARHTWHEIDQINAWVRWVVCARAPKDQTNDNLGIANDEPIPNQNRAIRLTLPYFPHNSSEIRAEFEQQRPVKNWLDPAVAGYIATHQLYAHHP
jgi:nicotinate-nucleotide adenylyltransferase